MEIPTQTALVIEIGPGPGSTHTRQHGVGPDHSEDRQKFLDATFPPTSVSSRHGDREGEEVRDKPKTQTDCWKLTEDRSVRHMRPSRNSCLRLSSQVLDSPCQLERAIRPTSESRGSFRAAVTIISQHPQHKSTLSRVVSHGQERAHASSTQNCKHKRHHKQNAERTRALDRRF